jgi:hypothetical protein
MMRRGLAAALALGALLLTGCAAPAGASAPATSIPEEKISSSGSFGMSVLRPNVDGTELVCVKYKDYDPISCNWELWNKLHDTAKK